MKSVVYCDRLYAELKKLIALPEHCTKIVLTLDVGKIPTVQCTYTPELETGETVTKLFQLVEVQK